MKRVLFVALILAVAFAGTASAMPTFGAKLGLNLANVSMDPKAPGASYGIRPGLMIGGMADFALPNPKMSIRAELAYAMKGSKVTYTGGDATMKLDEVVVAPFFVYNFTATNFTPFVEVGPEIGFVMSHKSESNGQSRDIADYASTNFGLNFGVGVSKPMGKGIGSVDLRYNLGLANMYTGSASNVTDKTNGIQLVLGYAFTAAK
ncbi:MAG TPA: porin family protein [bacterium]|jgi:hypothetical protein